MFKELLKKRHENEQHPKAAAQGTPSGQKLEANMPDPFTRLARRPQTLADTGLSQQFLVELASKHLYDAGALTRNQLSQRIALAGSIIEELLDFLRQEARLEVVPKLGQTQELYYGLTDRGRAGALDALMKSGYIGPAPVPLQQYAPMAKAQSIHSTHVSREKTHSAFSDVVLKESLLDQLGPAINSGRAIVIYGPAGTGKTYVTQRLIRLLGDHCLIPYALSINETVVQVFDPLVHHRVESPASESPGNSLMFNQGHDPRYALCTRPVVITGGELTLDRLDIHYDPANKVYRAPLQLKANNGMFIIDDMGRQRVAPVDLLNRWIVPMEEKKDFLSFGSGQNFEVPFDVILVFSTNLNPLELADEAFLRRIGHKIYFDTLDRDAFTQIWQQVCDEKGITFDQELLSYLFTEHYQKEERPMLPCHPRDLLGMAHDQAHYLGTPGSISQEMLDWAWNSYFVRLDASTGFHCSGASTL